MGIATPEAAVNYHDSSKMHLGGALEGALPIGATASGVWTMMTSTMFDPWMRDDITSIQASGSRSPRAARTSTSRPRRSR